MDNLQQAFELSRSFAQKGLNEAGQSNVSKEKWFYVWCGDIAGGFGELLKVMSENFLLDMTSEKILIKVGDVLWGVCALAMLNEITAKELSESTDSQRGEAEFFGQCLIPVLELLNYGKKICRDGVIYRPIDKIFLCEKLGLILLFLETFDLNKAILLTGAKLDKRHPNGYTPGESAGHNH